MWVVGIVWYWLAAFSWCCAFWCAICLFSMSWPSLDGLLLSLACSTAIAGGRVVLELVR